MGNKFPELQNFAYYCLFMALNQYLLNFAGNFNNSKLYIL
jgi:hypothetical protein